jgi:hypothetical protein
MIVNDRTKAEDFAEAALVVASLGDPGGEITHGLENRSPVAPVTIATIRNFEACRRP